MRWLIFVTLLCFLPVVASSEEKTLDAQVDHLASQAAHGDKKAREKALEKLGRLRHSKVGEILRERFLRERESSLQEMAGYLLSEYYPQDYYRALKTIVEVSRAKLLPFLINHAMMEDARYLRTLDLWAAARLDRGRTTEWLMANLKSKDRNILLRALELLGVHGDGSAGKQIVPLLWHEAAYVRIEAIEALAKLPAAVCDKQLASVALRDSVAHVRRHAVWAIYQRRGAAGLRRQFGPQQKSKDPQTRSLAAEALDVSRIQSKAEEGGVLPFRHVGNPASVLSLFRRAELGRFVTLEVREIDVKSKLLKALAQLQRQAPKYAHYVRSMLSKITADQKHSTGTYVTTRVFNIKPSTVRKWSSHHLSKTLVHDATHAYLHMMGEKSGEHRGEEECFQEAFWADRYLTGGTTRDYDSEVNRYLKMRHWVRKRHY